MYYSDIYLTPSPYPLYPSHCTSYTPVILICVRIEGGVGLHKGCQFRYLLLDTLGNCPMRKMSDQQNVTNNTLAPQDERRWSEKQNTLQGQQDLSLDKSNQNRSHWMNISPQFIIRILEYKVLFKQEVKMTPDNWSQKCAFLPQPNLL